MLEEIVGQPDPNFKPARQVKPVKPGDYKFGDGIAALAKSDPGLLLDIAKKTHSSLGATLVLDAINTAKADKKKKKK